MSCGFHSLEIKVRPWAGANIEDVCDEAQRLAAFLREDVAFEFNGTPLIATPAKRWQALVDEYWRGRRGDAPTSLASDASRTNEGTEPEAADGGYLNRG